MNLTVAVVVIVAVALIEHSMKRKYFSKLLHVIIFYVFHSISVKYDFRVAQLHTTTKLD